MTAPLEAPALPVSVPASPSPIRYEAALARLLVTEPVAAGEEGEAERREAAEALHALGTEEALRRLDQRPGHASARALLRDTRWDVPGAGLVPLLGAPGGPVRGPDPRAHAAAPCPAPGRTAMDGRLRRGSHGGSGRRRARRDRAGRWRRSPTRTSTWSCPWPWSVRSSAAWARPVSAPASRWRKRWRGRCAASPSWPWARWAAPSSGFAAHVIGRWTLAALFGQDLWMVGGGLEGLGLGAAAGLGYALATPRPEGGMAAPRGAERVMAASRGRPLLRAGRRRAHLGRPLAGRGQPERAWRARSRARRWGSNPLARLLGEREMGPVTRMVMAAYEGLLFGVGLILGLTRRIR